METTTIKFSVKGQSLTYKSGTTKYASNTKGYIFAEFDLDENWKSFDKVTAVWATDTAREAVDIGEEGRCEVPASVLTITSKVYVNLVGVNFDNTDIESRLTTYTIIAFYVDNDARIDGAE